MTRTMLSPCTATIPAARPMSLRFHDAGKASIAAIRTIVASTPLQPASIDTANPLAVFCRTFPCETTCGSNTLTMPAEMAARVSVHGTTNHFCAHGVSSRPKRPACIIRNQMKNRTMGPLFYRIASGEEASPPTRPSTAREPRVLCEIALGAREDGLGEALLLLLASESHLLVGVGDECGLDQN